MSANLTQAMARAIHPAPDGEDEAVAYAARFGVAAWLQSPQIERVAAKAVSDAMVNGNMPMSFGDTIRCVLGAVAAEALRTTEGTGGETA